jgi:hypothetical protein
MFTPMARVTKLLKLAKPVIAKPITKTKMINKTNNQIKTFIG